MPPGAGGNVTTEDVVYLLNGMEIQCGGVDLNHIIKAEQLICEYFARSSRSKVAITLASVQ